MNFAEEEREYWDKEELQQEQEQEQEQEEEEEVMTSKLAFSSPSSSSSSKYKNFLSPHQNIWLGSFESHQDQSEEPPLNFDKKLDLIDFSLGNNNETDATGVAGAGARADESLEREHMFDKVVTPSDVGKLNRLVIPKQHAEKYFPLDSSSTEKGLLLNFEDRNGKSWRFRYSYWNSSQSYVMTKGWSRFVKEKKLDAGDIVSFQRGVGDAGKHRLYIDWRRRPNAPDPTAFKHLELQNQLHFSQPVRWGRLYSLPQSLSSMPRQYEQTQLQHLNYGIPPYQYHQHHYHHHHQPTSYGNAAQYYLRPPGSHPHPIGGVRQQGGDHHHHHLLQQQQEQQVHVPMVIDSVPVVHGKTVGKRLRLFGVNMDCPTQDESSSVPILPHDAMASFSPHLASSSLPPPQLRMPNSASSMSSMQAELSKKGKSSLSFDLDL